VCALCEIVDHDRLAAILTLVSAERFAAR